MVSVAFIRIFQLFFVTIVQLKRILIVLDKYTESILYYKLFSLPNKRVDFFLNVK